MILGKYNQSKTITFDLVDLDGVDMNVAATFATGDVVIMKDEGAEANTTNLPTDEGTGYSLVLTATEMSAARIRVYVIDQTATKVWLDISLGIETYGNVSAEHAFDLDTAAEIMRGTDNAALATSLTTAQTDLDTITGSDGVTLATTQGLYAPSKAGDSMDMLSISGDTGAADALELQYDGTGLAGETYPATQAQIGNLSTGSSAISKRAALGTVNVGIVIGGTTYTNTYTLDGIFHSITEDGSGNFNVEYDFEVGGNGVGSEIVMDGYFSGNGDVLQVQSYNWVGAVWENIGTIVASSGSDVAESRFVLDVQHTGTGANIGEVKVRGYEAGGGLSAVQLNMDRVRIDYSIVSQSVGYANAAIWINTINGIAGIETHVNGIADKKVLTLADAITLNSVLHLDKFNASPDSSIIFAESHTNEVWEGEGWLLSLGGQDISGTHIYHCNDISGIGTTPAGECHILDSHMGALTLGACHITGGSFSSTFDAGAAGAYAFENVHSGVAGSGVPVLTFSGLLAATTINVRGWMGGGTWVFDSDCTASIEVLAGGSHTITTGGGDVEFRGAPKALSLITSGTSTTNIVVWSGAPITITGTGGTVNIYGVHGGITDSSSGTTVNNLGADITDLPEVLADTNELQTDWVNGGRLDLLIDSIITDIAGLNDLTAAQVNAEVVDALATDTYAESSGVPAATASLAAKIQWLATIARNKVTQTATTQVIRNDADSGAIGTSTVSDDGTTFIRGEFS